MKVIALAWQTNTNITSKIHAAIDAVNKKVQVNIMVDELMEQNSRTKQEITDRY